MSAENKSQEAAEEAEAATSSSSSASSASASAAASAASSSPAASSSAPLPPPPPSSPLYYESQSLARCALHTLNNLLQCACFTTKQLNGICEELTPKKFINPHKSVFGLGNYDVNVMMRALSTRGLEMQWFDERKPASSIPFSSLYGLVINVPSRGIGAYLGGHHWYCLKRFANGEWFLLDSERQNAAVEKKTGSSSVSAPASAPAAASGTRASAAVQNAALKIDSVEDYVSNLLSSFKSASKNRAQLFLITVAEPAPK